MAMTDAELELQRSQGLVHPDTQHPLGWFTVSGWRERWGEVLAGLPYANPDVVQRVGSPVAVLVSPRDWLRLTVADVELARRDGGRSTITWEAVPAREALRTLGELLCRVQGGQVYALVRYRSVAGYVVPPELYARLVRRLQEHRKVEAESGPRPVTSAV